MGREAKPVIGQAPASKVQTPRKAQNDHVHTFLRQSAPAPALALALAPASVVILGACRDSSLLVQGVWGSTTGSYAYYGKYY